MASPLAGATVLDRRVDVFVRGDGSLDETTHLEVRLETGEGGERWSRYPIVLDENRTLKSLAAWVRRPDGSRRELGSKDFDTVDLGDLERGGSFRQLAELAAAEHCASARRLRLEHLAAGPPAPR